MGKIGDNLWFDLDLNDSDFKSKVANIKREVEALSSTVKLDLDSSSLESKIRTAFEKKQQVNVDFNSKTLADAFDKALENAITKHAKIEVNKTYLLESIRKALESEVFPINVNVGKRDGKTEDLKETTKEVKRQQSEVSELEKRFVQLFSVDMIRRFLTELVKVGGEIEKQKLAMASIVGDGALSDQLYGKLSNLSMISPFDVQDIMKYSKQLSAFGIQYNDLYDTTKRLADIAAGVGVDFGRIAYEFGQTSARGHLDARELRMFANSGIPLLKKLSEYYSQIEGSKISASDVRTKITNKEVSFEDVKNVLWEMTDKGGQFYQMQEVMAESLAAKWRNLGNAWNLMLANMAESGLGDGLKRIAEILTTITKNWQTLLFAAAPAAVMFGGWSLALDKFGAKAKNATGKFSKLVYSIKGIGATLSSTFTGVLANPLLWASAIVGVFTGWWGHARKARQEIEAMGETIRKQATEGATNLRESYKNLVPTEDNPIESWTATQLQDNMKEMKETLKKYDPLWQDTFEGIFGVQDKEKLHIEDLKKQYMALTDELGNVKEAYDQLSKSDYDKASVWDEETGGFWWGKTFTENATAYGEAYTNAAKEVSRVLSLPVQQAEKIFNILISKLNTTKDVGLANEWADVKKQIDECTTLEEKYNKLLEFTATTTKHIEFGSQFKTNRGNNWYEFDTTSGFFEELNDFKNAMDEDSKDIALRISQYIKNTTEGFDQGLVPLTKDFQEAAQKIDDITRKKIAMQIRAMVDKSSVPDGLREGVFNDIWEKVMGVKVKFSYEDANTEMLSNYQRAVLSRLPELELYDKTYNENKELVSQTPRKTLSAAEKANKVVQEIVKKSADASSLADNLQKMYDNALKDEKQYLDDISASKGRDLTEKEIADASNEFKRIKEMNKWLIKYIKEAAVAGGINLVKKGKGYVDELLKELKNEYQQYKTIWQDYKLLSEKYGTEVAWDEIISTDAWGRVDALKNVKNIEGFLDVTKTFQTKIDKLLASASTNDENREGRKQFWQTIFKDLLTMDNDVYKPYVQKALAEVQDMINEAKEKYDFAKSIFNLTGDVSGDYNYIDRLAEMINERLSKTISMGKLLEMNDDSLKSVVKKNEIEAVKALLKEYKSATKDHLKDIRKDYEDAYSSIMTAQDKLVSEGAKMAQKLKEAMNAKDNDGNAYFTPEQIEQMRKAYMKILGSLALDVFKEQGGVLGNAFSDQFDGIPSILSRTISRTRQLLRRLSGEDVKIDWLSDEQIEEMRNNKNNIVEFLKDLEKAQTDYWSQFGNSSLGTFISGLGKGISGMKDYHEAMQSLQDDWDSLTDAEKESRTEQVKALKTGAMKDFGSAARVATDFLSKFASKMKELADATGDVDLGELADTLGGVAQNLGAAAEGFASTGSWIGAVVGGVNDLIGQLGDGIVSVKIQMANLKQSARDYARSLEMMKLAVDEDEYKSIFGTDEIEMTIDAYQKAQEAAQKYFDFINKRTDATNFSGGVAEFDNINHMMDAVRSNFNDLQSIAIKVKNTNWLQAAFGSRDQYKSLYDLAPEIWENGVFNADKAKAWLDTYKGNGLTNEIKAQIEYAIELNDAYEEAMDTVKDLLSSWYGDWGSKLTDAIFDSIISGTNAWDDFEKAGSEAILSIGKTMMTSTIFQSYFKQYEDQLTNAFSTTDPDQMLNNLLSVSGDIMSGLPAVFEAAQTFGEDFIKMAEAQGYNMSALADDSSSLTSSIKGVTEETANLLGGYINGIRADVSLNRTLLDQLVNLQLPQMSLIAETQLIQLENIANNTYAISQNTEANASNVSEILGILNAITSQTKRVAIE